MTKWPWRFGASFMADTEKRGRAEAMAFMRERGRTLAEIGQKFGVSKTRVAVVLEHRDFTLRSETKLLLPFRGWLKEISATVKGADD